jgi:DNA-binding transcriptional ArsR family regulator
MVVKSELPKHVPLAPAQLQAVADLFSVLSEPSRLRILQMLQRRAATVGEIVSATGMKQANVSKQLGILHSAGVLARQKEGNAVRYSIRLPLVFDLCALVCGSLHDDARDRTRLLRGRVS